MVVSSSYHQALSHFSETQKWRIARAIRPTHFCFMPFAPSPKQALAAPAAENRVKLTA
jgi:hypothetical protein